MDLFFSDLQRVSVVKVRTLSRAQFYIIFIYRKSSLFTDTQSRRTGRRCALNYPTLSKNFPFSWSSIVKYLDRKCVQLVCRTQCGATADKFLLATRSFNRDMCVSVLTIRVCPTCRATRFLILQKLLLANHSCESARTPEL